MKLEIPPEQMKRIQDELSTYDFEGHLRSMKKRDWRWLWLRKKQRFPSRQVHWLRDDWMP